MKTPILAIRPTLIYSVLFSTVPCKAVCMGPPHQEAAPPFLGTQDTWGVFCEVSHLECILWCLLLFSFRVLVVSSESIKIFATDFCRLSVWSFFYYHYIIAENHCVGVMKMHYGICVGLYTRRVKINAFNVIRLRKA